MADDKVIDILAKKPHCSGQVKCLACKHEWVGAALKGSVYLDCPECGCSRGVWKNHLEVVQTDVFHCVCGCDVFQVLRMSISCLGCGLKSQPWTT